MPVSDGFVINRSYMSLVHEEATEIAFTHSELVLRFLKANFRAQKYFIQKVVAFMTIHELKYVEIEIGWGPRNKRFMTVTKKDMKRLIFGLL